MLRTSTIRRFSFINSRAHEGRDILFLLPARFSNRFNSRAREGRDGRSGVCVVFGNAFQLTRPRGARPPLFARAVNRIAVSTHAPARGATNLLGFRTDKDDVSTHAPARGATLLLHSALRRSLSFNSRAREGRDSITPCTQSSVTVSTHAPARGATSFRNRFCGKHYVSTHAPARGATIAPESSPACALRFNSRAREGRD